MRKTLLLMLALATIGCSQDARLVGYANGSHKVKARWNLQVHTLKGGLPETYVMQVWENGSVFRAHVNSTVPSEIGPVAEECDILCDGKTVWQFDRKVLSEDGSEPMPNEHYTPADPKMMDSLYFWHVPVAPYNVDGTEKLLGRDCTRLKTTGKDITQNTVDVTCWIDPKLGYLLKRTNKSGEEFYGGQSECLEVEANPSFPAGHFDPPKESAASDSPPQLWGTGIKL
jgi:outer membrane lipoprotein-sorting protein